MRGPDFDDMLDRQMHDTFDPDAHSPADRPPAEPRPERSWSRGTPVRNLRLDDTRWAAVTDEAARTGTTASDIIRTALDHYLDHRHGDTP